jgi:tyrosinase
MMSRREFTAGVVSAVAAPYVLKTHLHAQAMRLRRDVSKLDTSDPLFAKYGEAIKQLHDLPDSDPRNWRNQALIHLNYCPHGAPDFPHWHRHYIANFELICGELIGDPSFALPYWNWSANQGRIPDPFFDLDLLNVEHWRDRSNASSANWGDVTTVGTRNLSKGHSLQDDTRLGGSFTKPAIDAIQVLSTYNIYVRRLEGSPHNNAHVIVGGANGHMGSGMSPLDPIFWLHHCNVDRIWAQWQAAGNVAPALALTYDGQFVDGAGQPVTASSSTAVDIAQLNYTYDVLSVPLVARESRRLELQPAEDQKVLSAQAVGAVPQPIGDANAPKTVATAVETRFAISVPDIIPNLFKSRTYWAPNTLGVKRLAAAPSRILARLANVSGPQTSAPILVNVFVNCPYLTPDTGSDDPHYADSFSFFGKGGSHDHEFVVDITQPLRALAADGRIATDNVNIQLMAVSVDPNVSGETTFTVGGVEVLRT